MKAWHFAREGNNLGYKDGRAIVLGETLTVDPAKIVPCSFGLHASVSAYDALSYAAGPMLWRVELGGVIVAHGDPVDKHAASERTAIAGGGDATEMLTAFARACALDVIDLWDAPQVVRDFLTTGDPSLRAAAWDASDAAWHAAWASAWTAASDAARNAARAASDAARDAASDATRDDASDAAWAATKTTAWATAWAAARDATKTTAWYAARDAAEKKQRERFEAMCLEFVGEAETA